MSNQASVVLSGHKTAVLPSEHRWENGNLFGKALFRAPLELTLNLKLFGRSGAWTGLASREHPAGGSQSRLAP